MFYFVVFFSSRRRHTRWRISDWSSDVCSSDLRREGVRFRRERGKFQIAHRAGGQGGGQFLPEQARHAVVQQDAVGPDVAQHVQDVLKPRLAPTDRGERNGDAADREAGEQREREVGARREEEGDPWTGLPLGRQSRSEEHTSELQSLMRISYVVFF